MAERERRGEIPNWAGKKGEEAEHNGEHRGEEEQISPSELVSIFVNYVMKKPNKRAGQVEGCSEKERGPTVEGGVSDRSATCNLPGRPNA